MYTNQETNDNFFHHIYPTPLLGQDMTQGQFLKWSLTGLNSEFSFSYISRPTKAEEPSLPYYLSNYSPSSYGLHLFDSFF